MAVELFLFELPIGDGLFAARIPAKSPEHAREIATSLGGNVLGRNIHERSAIPAEQLMEFCNAIADDEIRWKYNAAEQLEAFLAMGWPVRKERYDED